MSFQGWRLGHSRIAFLLGLIEVKGSQVKGNVQGLTNYILRNQCKGIRMGMGRNDGGQTCQVLRSTRTSTVSVQLQKKK